MCVIVEISKRFRMKISSARRKKNEKLCYSGKFLQIDMKHSEEKEEPECS